MKWVYVLLCMCACSGPSTPMDKPPLLDQDAEASNPIQDSGVTESTPPPYNPCLSKTFKFSSYPRLRETWCTDSNGQTYLTGYLDIQLNMTCRWRPATDGKTRCLPKNEQSVPVYVDSICNIPMGLVEIGSAPYIGIDTDAGVEVHQTGDLWKDTGTFYYKAEDCSGAYFKFPGSEFHLLGNVVNPNTFIEK